MISTFALKDEHGLPVTYEVLRQVQVDDAVLRRDKTQEKADDLLPDNYCSAISDESYGLGWILH